MQSSPHIRPMMPSDLSAVLKIQTLCYTDIEPESGQSLSAKLAAAPSTCFVAVHTGKIVGYLLALPWRADSLPALNASSCTLPSHPDCLYLHDLAVAPAAQGLGIARALVEQFFASAEVLRIYTACLIAVQGSELYWYRFGFTTVTPPAALLGTISGYGPKARYMRRDL